MDHVQFEPVCPSCLAQLRTFPRGRSKCPSCNVAIYVRTLDGGRVLADETGLVELDEEQQARRHRKTTKPCVRCGLQLDAYWRLCVYCEAWQHPPIPGVPPEPLTEEQKLKVMERQIYESMPELHEEVFNASGPLERALWLRRWNPPFKQPVRLLAVCGRCGAPIMDARGCGSCAFD